MRYYIILLSFTTPIQPAPMEITCAIYWGMVVNLHSAHNFGQLQRQFGNTPGFGSIGGRAWRQHGSYRWYW